MITAVDEKAGHGVSLAIAAGGGSGDQKESESEGTPGRIFGAPQEILD
jgi:hypothetical protein